LKRIINIILLSLTAIVCLAAVVVGILGQKAMNASRTCRGIDVDVTDSATIKFLDGSDIINMIDRDYGGYVNRPVDAVNLYEIESCLGSKPFVRKCTAYMTEEDILNISITQCIPVVKIVNDGRLWYIDETGGCFRIAKDWCDNIPVVTGPAPVSDKNWNRSISSAFIEFSKNERLKSSIMEAESDGKGELTLHLLSRNEDFIYGYPTENEEKIERIIKYLDRIADRYGKEYTSINVKYSGQVVCR